MIVKAEVIADHQHGPIVSITIDGKTVSVYLVDETGIYTDENSRQAGIEVTGPWVHFWDQINEIRKILNHEEQPPHGQE